jgi:hypothetical protein
MACRHSRSLAISIGGRSVARVNFHTGLRTWAAVFVPARIDTRHSQLMSAFVAAAAPAMAR